MLQWLLHRLAPAAQVDEWWVATTREAADAQTEEAARACGAHVYRGDVDDVLSRFSAIVRDRRPRWVVRVTADNPFVDAVGVDLLMAQAIAAPPGVAHVDAGPDRRLPLGYVQEAVNAEALLLAEAEIPAAARHHRSHVTSWLRERGQSRSFVPPDRWPARDGWRWTVDDPRDLAMVRATVKALGNEWPTAGYEQIVAALDARPQIPAMNAGVKQKRLVEG